jgi:hypothetical protein
VLSGKNSAALQKLVNISLHKERWYGVRSHDAKLFITKTDQENSENH